MRAAVLMGCRPADAEDAAQDALARCYAAWTRVAAADDPEAYAYRVLVNGVVRAQRRRWHGELPHAQPPEQPVDGPDPALRADVAPAPDGGRPTGPTPKDRPTS